VGVSERGLMLFFSVSSSTCIMLFLRLLCRLRAHCTERYIIHNVYRISPDLCKLFGVSSFKRIKYGTLIVHWKLVDCCRRRWRRRRTEIGSLKSRRIVGGFIIIININNSALIVGKRALKTESSCVLKKKKKK